MDSSVFNIEYQNDYLSGKIVVGLERISEAFKSLLWDHAKNIGLSPIQIQVLIFIKYHPEHLCNVSALAIEFNLTKPTISDAVKVLAKKELIEKLPSTVDKRAYSIRLKTEGERIVEQTEHFAKPIEVVASTLNQNEQEHFFDALSRIIEGLNKKGILSVQRSCHNCKYFIRSEELPFCKLLNQKLSTGAIRLDCPEFEVAL